MSTRYALLLVGGLWLAACGGGGGGTGGGDGGSGVTLVVVIDAPYRPDPADATAELYGIASCDGCPPSVTAFGYCPAIDAPRASAIDVTWTNRATNASGATNHAIVGRCSCLLSQCTVTYSHRWSAQVPLGIGDNPIDVRASGGGGSGQATVTVSRMPSVARDLTAVAGPGQVTLSWGSVSGATSYNLYFGSARDVTPATGTKISGVSSPFAHTGLTDNVTHYYTLTTVAGGFESSGSPVAWATPGWQAQTIGATMPTTTYSWRDVSIATDSASRAHVHQSWGDVGPGGLLRNDYLTNASGSWETRNAALPSRVHAGLALDAADTVHVSYFTGSLRHAVLIGDVWTAESAAADAWCTSSLALDAGGKTHLAYFTGSLSPRLRYATNVSGAWVASDIAPADAGCGAGVIVSLAVDSAGAAHVAYNGAPPGYGLQYATNRGGTWTSTTLEGAYIQSVSIAVDGSDKLHIAYSNIAGELKYAQDVTGAWTREVLENAGSPNHAALALDATGRAHVSYTDGRYGGEVRYLTNASGAWRLIPVDVSDYDNGGVSTDTAIAVDAQGKARIAYYRGTALRYATNR